MPATAPTLATLATVPDDDMMYAMGDRHVSAARTRFVTPAMRRHVEECVCLGADTAQSKKPMPEGIRMPVRDRALNRWK